MASVSAAAAGKPLKALAKIGIGTIDPIRAPICKRDGIVIGYNYDALNRMTWKGGSGVVDTGYSYDLRGLQTSAWTGSGTVASAYDGFGRLTSSTITMSGVSRTLSYQYDADGNRTRITHPDSNYFTYSYDGLDRPTAILQNGSTTVATMSWDNQGRRSGEGRGVVATTYGYDPISRPNSLTDNLAGTAYDITTTFGYNPASQITSRTRSNTAYSFGAYTSVNRSYTTNGLNQYTAVAGNSYGYDANGNLTTDGVNSYTYDAENRLVVTSTGAQLIYDPLGRLYETYKASTGTTRFLYDGDQLTAEYDGSGNLLRRYVHGTGEDDPLLWYEGAGLTDRRSLQIDHQGSIVSVADASGNATAVYSYDEYGVPGGSYTGRFQYTGQAWIPELGMYYYKARIYSPMLGRFLQTDPVGYEDQINLYAYVGNDPVDGRDPTGECSEEDGWTGCEIVVTGCTSCHKAHPPAPPPPAQRWNIRIPSLSDVGGFVKTTITQAGAAACVATVVCPAIIWANSPPEVPDDFVGEQDSRAGEQGNRHNSGPLRPDKGGTGNAEKDFDKLTGGKSRPAGPNDRMPPGSRIGDNGIRIRPGSKPRIDIPSKGSKPHETLHY